MTPRRPTAKAVRERPAVDPSEGLDDLVDDEASDEEEQLARSRSVVRPIRDEPDHLVFRFEVGPAILAQLLEKLDRIERIRASGRRDDIGDGVAG